MTPTPSAATADGDLEAFAALAAHQLGEAVALIRASSSLLQGSGARAGPERVGALSALDAGVDRAQRFVDDLLDVVTATHAELNVEDVELEEVLQRALQTLADPLRRTGTTVEAGALPPARLDRRLAERLLVHVLRPALASGAKRVTVQGAATADGVTVCVVDDGTAPAADALDRLFEPFTRARGSGPFVGAGVSLAVCRRITERHGGTLAGRVGDDRRFEMTIGLPAVP